jgi:uncharacterized membrane protein
MKNPYRIAALCLIVIAVFLKTGIAGALFVFFLVGAIPGTSYNIPASGMLFLFMIPLWLVFVRITMLESVQNWTKNKINRNRTPAKKRPSRKRIEQI